MMAKFLSLLSVVTSLSLSLSLSVFLSLSLSLSVSPIYMYMNSLLSPFPPSLSHSLKEHRKVEEEDGNQSKAWKTYMKEVRELQEKCCTEKDDHKRPLVK